MSTNNPVLCPTCQVTIEWNDKFPYRPFCSHRCQQIDFGDWATEQYRVAGDSEVAKNLEDEDNF